VKPRLRPATPAGAALLRLWALGFAIDLIAFFFAHRYPLMGHSGRLTDIGKLSHYGKTEFAEYVAGMLAITLCVLLALRQTRRLSASTAAAPVFTCSAVALLFFGLMYPVNAIDIFIYASRSRLWTHYGENPIAVKPAVHQIDAWRHFASEWGNSTSPYGPLWNWIAWPATKISGDDIGKALAGFKVLAGASILIGAAVIYAIANRLRPGTGAAAALLYCWNPLVLWEGAGNGHNDVVMLIPILAALLLLVSRRFPGVIPLIVAAAMIKYVALLLIPFAVIAIWRLDPPWKDRFRNAVWSLIGSVAVIAFSLAPFFDVKAIRASLKTQSDIVLTSSASLAIGLYRKRYPIPTITHWAHLIGYSILAVGFASIVVLTWRRPGRSERAWFEMLFLYLITAAWTVRPWYGIWLVALAAVLPLGWPAARAMIWSLGGLASYGLWIWGWEWWKVDYYRVQNVGVLITLGPPIIFAVLEVVVRIWRRRSRSPARA
jgi:alpha-1,6-mannosyltransferase